MCLTASEVIFACVSAVPRALHGFEQDFTNFNEQNVVTEDNHVRVPQLNVNAMTLRSVLVIDARICWNTRLHLCDGDVSQCLCCELSDALVR